MGILHFVQKDVVVVSIITMGGLPKLVWAGWEYFVGAHRRVRPRADTLVSPYDEQGKTHHFLSRADFLKSAMAEPQGFCPTRYVNISASS